MEATWSDDGDDRWDEQRAYEKQSYARNYEKLTAAPASKQVLSPKLQAVTAVRSASVLGLMPSTKLGQELNRRSTSVPLMPAQSIIAFCFLTPATALACAAGALLVGAGALGAANTIATQNNRASNVGGSSSYNGNSLRYGGSGILDTMYTITRTMATAAAYWLSNPESNYEGIDLLQETPDISRGFPLITATALPPQDGGEIVATQTPDGLLDPTVTITLVPTPWYLGTPDEIIGFGGNIQEALISPERRNRHRLEEKFGMDWNTLSENLHSCKEFASLRPTLHLRYLMPVVNHVR